MLKINGTTCSGLKKSIKLIPYVNLITCSKLIINSILRCWYQNDKTKLFELFEVKHQIIREWLENNLQQEFQSCLIELRNAKNVVSSKNNFDKAPIWVLWWQGRDNMPETVLECQKALAKNANNHPVLLITKDNISDYINLPVMLFERFEKGLVTIQSLSDIIRMNLLYKYGGLWIDSTMFLMKPVDENIFEASFFSLKQNVIDNLYVSKYRWDSSFIVCQKESVYANFFSKILLAYSLKYDFLLDYFVTDYIIDYLTIHDDQFSEIINNLPFTNHDTNFLSEKMNDEYNELTMSKLLQSNFVFKLNHRRSYNDFTVNGKETYYRYFKSVNMLKNN